MIRQKLMDLIVRWMLRLVVRYNDGTLVLPSKMNLTIISSEWSIVSTGVSHHNSARITNIASEPTYD